MKDPLRAEPPLAAQEAPEDEDDTRDERYRGVWERLRRKTPELLEAAQRRRDDVERLYAELARAEPARQLRMVREPRFQSVALLDWLLEQSHERQLANPAQGAQLGRLAIRLATGFRKATPEAARDRAEAVAALPRAFCLAANALRLDARPAAADALLAKGSLFLSDALERAFYCRTLAVLRWEQARTDEARALLAYAASLYARDGLEAEAALCRTLLGMVLQEAGSGDAAAALHRGWSGIDRGARPLAALRGALALAAALAQAGQPDRARQALSESWSLYVYVKDPAEMDRVVWWEARALARLGNDETALELLESVRRQLLAEPSPAEAALVSVDLALALKAGGRDGELDALAKDLTSVFPEIPVLALAAEGIRSLIGPASESAPSLSEAGMALEITLRRAFRVCGLKIRPFPVV
jgi:hypothetical protein